MFKSICYSMFTRVLYTFENDQLNSNKYLICVRIEIKCFQGKCFLLHSDKVEM